MAEEAGSIAKVEAHLDALLEYPDRHVGGEGNRAATAYVAGFMQGLGLIVERSEMPCFEWVPGAAALTIPGGRLELNGGPYSLPCDLTAPLLPVSSIEELEREEVRGAIVLLHGAIASEQFMPRNFTFYNPESHQRVYRALDEFAPAALIAATGRDPQMVGSQYPFPLFEDGDLDVPNAYLTDVEGGRLVAHAGSEVHLRIDSERKHASAEHVVGRLPGTGSGRIVVTAHIDSRRGSPGALDNASGVATLLVAAELLRGHAGSRAIEFVPFNGEDDYANPGELQWVAENAGRFDEIALGINIDDSGHVGALNNVSFYDCPSEVESVVRELLPDYPEIEKGPQWFQGDHSILGIYGRPAIAIASASMVEFMQRYAHTERDTRELADPALIARTGAFVADAIRHLSCS